MLVEQNNAITYYQKGKVSQWKRIYKGRFSENLSYHKFTGQSYPEIFL